MEDRFLKIAFLAFALAGLGAQLAVLGWDALVSYRQKDGLAFVRDKTFRHALAGHRCSAAVYNWCFEHLPGEPRDNDDECVPPVTARCWCDRAAGSACYTAFPVDCATWGNDGQLQFDACDRVFPHGPKHSLELLLGREIK